jgi:hypothetical protein
LTAKVQAHIAGASANRLQSDEQAIPRRNFEVAKNRNQDDDENEESDHEEGEEGEEGEEDDGGDDPLSERRRRNERNQRIRLGILVGLSAVALVLIVMAIINIVAYVNSPNSTTPPTTSRAAARPTTSDRSDSGTDGPMSNVLAGVGGLVCMAWVLLPFLYLLVSVLVGIWVIKDCRNRSMGDLVGVIWMLMIFPFNVIALIIYLGSRPTGHLVACRRCRNPKLAHVLKCPHCQQRVESHLDE